MTTAHPDEDNIHDTLRRLGDESHDLYERLSELRGDRHAEARSIIHNEITSRVDAAVRLLDK